MGKNPSFCDPGICRFVRTLKLETSVIKSYKG